MNSFDLLILGIVAIFAALGAWRGLMREVITLLTWGLAGVLAWFYAAPGSPLFKGVREDAVLRQLFAFVLIFALVFVLGLVASWLIHKYFPLRRVFRSANIVLGGLIGTARGAVIVIAVVLVAGLTSVPQRDWWRDAAFTPFFERAAVYVAGYIPRDIARHIRYG